MPSFATALADAVYAALGKYPLQEIYKLPQLISGEFERLSQTPEHVTPFRDDDDPADAMDNSRDDLPLSPGMERVLLAQVALLPPPPKDIKPKASMKDCIAFLQ